MVERLAVDEVRLVQNEDVRERDLLGALVASPELLLDMGCIDERDDPVKRELRANFVVHEEGLSDRTGIGEPGGLHQHIVELVAALHELAEHANQVSAHRAADAAVRHLEDLFVSVDDERLIDADLPVLVLDHGNALAVLLAQDPVEQGRLAGAEEAGEDGNGYFLRCVHLVLLGLRPRPISRASLALVISERNVITLCACGAMEINVMTLPSIQPRPCTDSNCRGQHAPAERVALAMSLCDARGAQLTTLRRQVLELLWESGRPTGAYELIEALKLRNSRAVGPPTVYRALEFLMSQRFVLKIESRNAYVPCAHPERRHDCLFFICSNCGVSAESEDPRVEQLLAEDAAVLGFRVTRRVVEVEGTCGSCIAAGPA